MDKSLGEFPVLSKVAVVLGALAGAHFTLAILAESSGYLHCSRLKLEREILEAFLMLPSNAKVLQVTPQQYTQNMSYSNSAEFLLCTHGLTSQGFSVSWEAGPE